MRKRIPSTGPSKDGEQKTEPEPSLNAFSWTTRCCGIALLLLGLGGCTVLTWLSFQTLEPSRQAVPFVVLYGLLFVVYLMGLWWLRAQSLKEKSRIILIVGVALALRLALLPGPPLLDDDIYRYRWDGKVLAHGRNPYAYPPEAEALEPLRAGDPLFEKIGFRDIPAVYPPVSQLLFAVGYTLTPDSILGIKLLVELCDFAVILALIGLLRALGRTPEMAAIYAWNPLILKEFANSGHHDAAGIALLVFAISALVAGRRAWSAFALAAATLIKPILLLLAPALWTRLRARDWLAWIAITIAAYLPFAQIGPQRLFAGMTIYARHWEMNDSVFALIQAAFGGPKPSQNPGFLFETNPSARLTALALWLCAATFMLYDVIRERRGPPLLFGPPEGGMIRTIWRLGVLLSVALALTPTLDPWYVCWLIPFLCLLRWDAGLMLTATVALSYVYYWQDRDLWWLRPSEYLPVAAMLVWSALRWRTALQHKKRGGGEISR